MISPSSAFCRGGVLLAGASLRGPYASGFFSCGHSRPKVRLRRFANEAPANAGCVLADWGTWRNRNGFQNLHRRWSDRNGRIATDRVTHQLRMGHHLARIRRGPRLRHRGQGERMEVRWVRIIPFQIAAGLLLGSVAGATGALPPSFAALFGVYLVWGIGLGWNARSGR